MSIPPPEKAKPPRLNSRIRRARDSNRVHRHTAVLPWIAGGIFATLGLGLAFLLLTVLTDVGGPRGFVVGGLMAVAPVPLYVGVTIWLDRFEKEPLWMLGLSFFWGAFFSVFFAFALNTLNESLFTQVFGEENAGVAGSILSAPLVEESFKGLVLIVLYFWQKKEFDGVLDGIVYASMVGLGFAMTENALYYGQAMAESGFEGSVASFFMRGVISPYSHPMFTSALGIGLGIARQTQRRTIRYLAPAVGFAASVALHFVWNLASTVGSYFFLCYFVVMVPALCCLLILVGNTLKQEGAAINQQLAPEIQRGLLSPLELSRLSTVMGRALWDSRVFLRQGYRAWLRLHRFQQLTSELAFHRLRVERGIVRRTAEVYAEEASMLREMWQLRQNLDY